MIHARDKMMMSICEVFPRPVTVGCKMSFSRGFWPSAMGVRGFATRGPGGVAKLLQAQAVDVAEVSAFCNAATLATPCLVTCAHTRACGCGHGHMIARACAVAVVAVLHNRDICYLSIGYRSLNLQRGCNGCNEGRAAALISLMAMTGRSINNGRKLGSGAGQCGAGSRMARSAGWRARAAGSAAASWAASPASWAAGDGSPIGLAGDVGAAGNSSMISMGLAHPAGHDAPGLDAPDANREQYQHVGPHHPLVYSTSARHGRAAFGLPDMPPPLRGTPTPKPPGHPSLPAHRPAVFQSHGGKHPAKLRMVQSSAGVGWGPGSQGRGAGPVAGLGTGSQP